MEKETEIQVIRNQTGMPSEIIFDERSYTIEKIIRIEQYIAQKTGKLGLQYLILIRGQERMLKYYGQYQWTIEKIPQPDVFIPKRKAGHCCRDMREEKNP